MPNRKEKVSTATTTDPVATLPTGMAGALDTSQASLYTGLAASTLEKKRVTGDGPRFVRYSRKAIRYLVADLDHWMAARTVSSTSERVA